VIALSFDESDALLEYGKTERIGVALEELTPAVVTGFRQDGQGRDDECPKEQRPQVELKPAAFRRLIHGGNCVNAALGSDERLR
jgi:hypothetical protein